MFERTQFDFNNLFIFEMANNHQGSVEHGLRIIDAMADIARKHEIRGAIKFQFRDLDTFIHPDFKESQTNKHIPRFLSTRLSDDQFRTLVEETKKRGLIAISTPFDEPSVDRIGRFDIDVIKIGSCSAQDWPLLEKAASANKPVIISTGGLAIKDVDKIVSFFQKRAVHFALMHCVAIYPTPNELLHLNHIEIMRNRYPRVVVGFSTHENPGDSNVIRVAYAKGARIFEKHVGVPYGEISLNAYSANPAEVDSWVRAYKEAADACGGESERIISEKEKQDLRSLMRGVYAKNEIKKGSRIHSSDVFFAIPLQEGQLACGRWVKGLIADRDYASGEPVTALIRPDQKSKKEIIYHAIHSIKGMLNQAKIPIGHDFKVELSHHYGIKRFHEIGCALIECFNREYAKKIIIQLPGQWNPPHYHKKKDETFQVISGNLIVTVDERKKILEPGDSLWIPRGVLHSFGTEMGALVEEISTTHYNNDSFYADKEIASLPREDRKTHLLNWGRHQLDGFENDGE